jgi:hypothetical protein
MSAAICFFLPLWAALPAPAAAIVPRALPTAIVGMGYDAGPLTLTSGQDCPQNHAALRIVEGQLPNGLELSAAGYFSGSPSEPGTFSFVVRAANPCGSRQQKFTLEVTGAPVLVVTPDFLHLEYQIGSGPLQPLHLRVASSHNGLAYRVDAPAWSWLRLRQRHGATPIDGSAFDSDIVEVAIDSRQLSPGRFQIPLRFSAWRSANNPVVLLHLNVTQPELPLKSMALPLVRPMPLPLPPVPTLPPRIWVAPPEPPKPPPAARPFGRSRFRYPLPVPAQKDAKPSALGAPVAAPKPVALAAKPAATTTPQAPSAVHGKPAATATPHASPAAQGKPAATAPAPPAGSAKPVK